MKENFPLTPEDKESSENKYDEEYCASFFEYSKIPGQNREMSIMHTLHAPSNKQKTQHGWILKTGYQRPDGVYLKDPRIDKTISFEEGIEILKKYGCSVSGKSLLTTETKEALGIKE